MRKPLQWRTVLIFLMCFLGINSLSRAQTNVTVMTGENLCRKVAAAFFTHSEFSFDISSEVNDRLAKLVSALIDQKIPHYLSMKWDNSKGNVISSERLLANVLGVPDLMIVKDSNDLKYIPFTLENSHILLVVDDQTSNILTTNRLQKVISIAQAKNIVFHLLYTSLEEKSFQMLSKKTGGQAILLDKPSVNDCLNL